jgi:hypothetical protein
MKSNLTNTLNYKITKIIQILFLCGIGRIRFLARNDFAGSGSDLAKKFRIRLLFYLKRVHYLLWVSERF